MSRRNSFLGLLTIALALTPAAVRAEFRLATVDLNRVLNDSSQAKEKRQSLETLTASAKKKIAAKRDSVAGLEKKLKEGNYSEESKEVQNYKNEVKGFQRFVKDTEEEVQREFLKINKELTQDAVKIVKVYAESHDIDLVVDKSEKVRGPVVFGAATADITDDVIKQLDK